VHASLTPFRTIPLVFYEGALNAAKLQEIFDEVIPKLCDAFDGHQFVLQHDRHPAYTAGSTQRYLQDETPASVIALSPTEFPANSPDFNLAERAMAITLTNIAKLTPRPKTKEEMRQALINTWNAWTEPELRALYDGLPEKLRQARANKGGNTTG
jgi:hypothetical protein